MKVKKCFEYMTMSCHTKSRSSVAGCMTSVGVVTSAAWHFEC